MIRPVRARIACLTAAALLLAGWPGALPIAAQSDITSAGELTIKIGFLINFPKFVDWPAGAFDSPRDPFVVAVIGDDPLAAALVNAFRDRREGDRSVTVVRLSRLEEMPRIHMLYVSESEDRRLPDVLKRVQEQPVLTVGSLDRFAERGGMIQLFTRDGKVRFALNSRTARRAGLRLSSRLLNLAGFVLSD